MGRTVAIALGVLMFLVGLVWTLQGLGYLGGSPMTDQDVWAIVGPAFAGLGVALVWVAATGRRS
ncbi:hypothetical protein ACFP3Q_18535 [Nocardioides sp. GCM10027113]|uniref:hypothetical protein n=1 Tax=unclassified Nocardioides TaxID=2615069 RepID=UPI00360DBF83